jgi:MFS family permease
VVLTLGVTQTVSWASSYYIPAILAVPIARSLGLPNDRVFAAFTAALVLMAAVAPFVGRQIDRIGGRTVLSLSHVVIAVGLAALALANGPWLMASAWLILGFGMALGLYDAAFAALAGFYGKEARSPITGVTLLGGFASTIGWPIHAVLEQHYGWRVTCFVWAATHILVCLPLSLLTLPRHASSSKEPLREKPTASAEPPPPAQRSTMVLISLLFAAAWFVTGSMAVHLPRLLESLGATATAAIAAAVLVGPAQVAARLVEFSAMRQAHPIVSARIATILHPIGAAILFWIGAPAVAVFAVLHGAGNGLLTIVRGTLPLALFGPQGYGFRQGMISAPARMTQALSPFLFGLIVDSSPLSALLLSSGLMLLSFTILLALKPPRS